MPKSAGGGRHGLPGLRRRRGDGRLDNSGARVDLPGPGDPGDHSGLSGQGDEDGQGGSGSIGGADERRRRPAGKIAALTGAVAVLAAGGVTLAYVGLPGSSRTSGSAQPQGESTVLPLGSRSISQAGSRPEFAGGSTASPSAGPSGSAATGPLRTSCQAVAHIGDSTSDGLTSPDYLPKKWQRIPARYKDVGVRHVWTNIEGARSIVEVIPGTTNAYDAARQLTSEGFRGCWVLALGTDDTADVAAGSLTSLPTRIHRMMAAAHGQPVMWVNVKTLLSSGPYAEANMQRWNQALLHACARYQNMRIYDWASAAKRRWFISDGIHYTSPGYAARGRLIADALARAFPAHATSPGCVIR